MPPRRKKDYSHLPPILRPDLKGHAGKTDRKGMWKNAEKLTQWMPINSKFPLVSFRGGPMDGQTWRLQPTRFLEWWEPEELAIQMALEDHERLVVDGTTYVRRVDGRSRVRTRTVWVFVPEDQQDLAEKPDPGASRTPRRRKPKAGAVVPDDAGRVAA